MLATLPISDMTVTFLVLGAVVILFVTNAIRVELVALGAALTLYATGVLELDQSLAGFSDPAVILIASLFVVSEGLDISGITTWAGQKVIGQAGASRPRLIVLILLLVAMLTALISVNGSVAALVPMVVIVAVRTKTPPSWIFMPLAFGAHAGSMLALTGTPVNVLISEAAAEAGAGQFGFFEFALVGVPLVAGTIVVVVLFGSRLLPNRTPKTLPPDLSSHARTLGLQYLPQRHVFRLEVQTDSPCIGMAPDDDGLVMGTDVELVGVQSEGEGPLGQSKPVTAGDVILVRGEPDAVELVASKYGLVRGLAPFSPEGADALISRSLGVAEVVIPPRSDLVGTGVFPGMITESGDLVVLAVQRQGEDMGPSETILAVGDTLLVQGEWDAIDQRVAEDPNVLMVDHPERIRRQAVPMGSKSPQALIIVAIMVALLATGAVPPVVAGLLAACAMVLLRVMSVEHAYRGISWTTVVLVAAMIPLSTAMTQTGAAERLASILVDVVGDSGPYALLLGLFVLTAILGQLISNMATALIVIPIALSASAELGVSVQPVMMCVTVAAAAALLTPVATPANLMVMGPGGYRFGDYWKLGLPLLVLYGLVAVLLVPVIWSF